jgi:Peptidase family M23
MKTPGWWGLMALLPLHGFAAPLIDFPTANHALAQGQPQGFFMYVNRDFEGEKSKPWQGGQFGYVRGPVRQGDKVVYIQFHEGVDIQPLTRDAQGNPLDPVLAAADGQVVYTSGTAGASNYGRYVVIEHREAESPFYTLYAHLNTISVQTGQTVRQGEPIAQMGFTGVGIDRERAHVHFEVCMMLSRHFEAWHAAVFPNDPNRHGIYNGLNLTGADPARLLLESRTNPAETFRGYFSSLEPAFKIAIRNTPAFDLIRDYPWLVPAGQPASPPAWVVSFSRHGVPVKIEAYNQPLPVAKAVWVKNTDESLKQATKGLIAGTTANPQLTDSGQRFARLLEGPDSTTEPAP